MQSISVFLEKQKLMISCDKILTSAELKGRVTQCFLDLP